MTGSCYDAAYYKHHCGPLPYKRSDLWLSFFGRIADEIVERLAPATVLDAGCAMGFLVEALRDRGVDAYGIDISEYAIGEVRDDVRPYCRVGSITEPLERDYDVIVCIEVLEHLTPDEGGRALDNICASAGSVLFSSTPSDLDEESHMNVQAASYWAERFAQRGFLRDFTLDWAFVTPWAMLFLPHLPVERVIASYEDRLSRLTNELELFRRSRAIRYSAAARRLFGRWRRRAA